MIEQRPASQAFGELADELLARGARFRFQAKGRSMWPLIGDGEILHVQSANARRLRVGDIVLFRQGAEFKAHRIIGKQKHKKHEERVKQQERVQTQFITRGDASQDADGAITGGQIVGKIIAKECSNSGAIIRLDGLAARLSFFSAETRRQARKYLSRPIAFARPAFLFFLLAFTALPFAHSQVALDVVAPFVLTSAGTAAGGNTTYQGTITGGAANAYTGVVFTVAGFTAGVDNGTFTCTASTATSLTLANGAGVAQTHAATATSLATSSVAQVVTQAANTVTFAHNTITGANLVLVVGVSMNISALNTTTVSGVTYNGVALTRAGFHNDSTNVRRVEMWYLIGPATGNHNVVVTESVPLPLFSIGTVVGATTFTGVDQTSPIRAFASNDSNGTASDTANVTVASGTNDIVLDTLSIDGSHTVSAPSGTQVQQWAITTGAAGTDVYGYGSTHAGAASVPMGELLSNAIVWAEAAVSIQPSQADLAVSVTGTSALFPLNLTYTVTVTNNGPAIIPSSGSVPGTTVTLTDTLAGGLILVSATPSQGSCSGTTTITCNLVTNATGIAVGASVTITVVVTPGAPGGYPNTASVTSSVVDLVNANNSSTGVAFSDFAACATSTLTAGGTLTGIINAYYPGTATANAGSTSITLGTSTGAATPIAIGDLVLIIQMQDAAINSSNSISYGDGISGSGSTALNNAGAYEYATATSAVPVGGGTLTVTAAGPGGGLLYTYTSAAASATQGARTFQVVRVPNYTTATLGAALTGSAWNGSTGGILALNLSGALTLNSATVHMDGLGFRGGASLHLVGSVATLTQVAAAAGGTTMYTGTVTGGAGNALAGTTFIVAGFANAGNNGTFVATASTTTTLTLANASGVAETHAGTASMSPGATNSDFAFLAPNSYAGFGTPRIGADGSKGEGIAGTPHWLESGGTFLNTNQTFAEGYPNGSMARGAPGNAGGGGTDGDPATAAAAGNDMNAGGGGGANGGGGGQGGDSWSNNLTVGGLGGSAFPADINRVVMGGGGGAGSANNNTSNASSSAAAGGGMILIRAGNLTGTATMTANGATGFNTTIHDAGGGGGAGGSIIVLTGTGGEAGLTLQAQGGVGGNAWSLGAYSNANRHGPGGGGGGGVVLTSSVTGTPTISVTGGASGTTLTGPSVTYGATAGTSGVSVTNLTLTSSPGQHSATICTDMSITKTGAPQPVLQSTTLTYTVTVKNLGPNTATGVTVVDTLPSQVTFQSVVPGGPTCSQSGGVVTCNYATMASGLTQIITIKVTAATPSLALNTAVVNSATPDPILSNNTATFTSTIEYPNAVKLNTFVAGQTGPAVLVTWRSGGEMHNLGYNVYRESGGSKVQLNPSLIAGSALSMRETVEQHGAKSYAWIDRSPVNGGLYWLEDVDLNGSRTMYGPISVDSGPSPTHAVASSAMLSDTARSNAALGTNGARSHIREAVVTPVISKATLTTGFQLAAQPAVKIFVAQEGWYHVTQPQLVAAGLNPNLQASSLHLFAEGVEQPIRITGAASVFGSQGAIEFYGSAIDTPYSGQRVYWLMSSPQPGLRIPGPSGAGSPGPQAQSFVQTLELKPRTTYFAVLLNENSDNFFGPLISPTAAVQTLNVSNMAPGAASIMVALQGVTQQQQHDVTVAVNGATLGNITFVGQQQGKAQFTIPSGILINGANTITLTAQLGSNDLSLIDHIDVSFLQTFTAQSDLLKFTAPAGDSVTVNGFAQAPTRLVDITNPVQPFAVAYTVSTKGSGYALQTTVPWTSSGTHTLLALADDQLAVPASLAPHQPSTLHQPQAGAGVVVLTAAQFVSQMQTLAALHQAEGRPVVMVTADQVYDEFNFGERTPYAIKNFLQTATAAWTNKPHYLLLGGDASVDPRDYLGFGFFDFVPTKIVVTAELKTASDDWFSDFGNTGFAQIATGRLPARTVSDAQAMVGKILSYANANAQPASWTNNSMLVADTDDPSVSFSQAAQAVQKLLPPAMTVNDVFAGTVGVSTARQDILAGINSGQLLVNYNGHGSVQVWGNSLFDDTAAASLTNGNRLPLFVMMNCLNGFFHDVYTQSLAEALLLSPHGGAVAVWASSGLTAPDPQFQMDQVLVKTLFAQPSIPLGDAVLFAKSGIADSDTRRTFILFGDPLMRLKQSGAAAQSHVLNPAASRAPGAR
jgi:uncharacterized repeat protein (TIGR01451 family)